MKFRKVALLFLILGFGLIIESIELGAALRTRLRPLFGADVAEEHGDSSVERGVCAYVGPELQGRVEVGECDR